MKWLEIKCHKCKNMHKQMVIQIIYKVQKDFLKDKLDIFMLNYTGAKRSENKQAKRKTRSKKKSRKKEEQKNKNFFIV